MLAVEPFAQAQLDLPDGSVLDLDELTEVLVRDVEVRDGLRRIELTVYDGAVRAIVPATPESGSSFRVATPVGVVEVQSGDVSVEVDGETGAARVLVLDGSAVVQAGAGQLTVSGAGSAPGAGGDRLLDRRPGRRTHAAGAGALAELGRSRRRPPDRPLLRDIAAPQDVGATALSPEAHPAWASQIRVRRGLIERRALDLAAALGPEGLAKPAHRQARHAAGRDAWGLSTGNKAHRAGRGGPSARVRRWTARAPVRAERLAAVAGTLAALRQAYLAAREPGGPPATVEGGVPY